MHLSPELRLQLAYVCWSATEPQTLAAVATLSEAELTQFHNQIESLYEVLANLPPEVCTSPFLMDLVRKLQTTRTLVSAALLHKAVHKT